MLIYWCTAPRAALWGCGLLPEWWLPHCSPSPGTGSSSAGGSTAALGRSEDIYPFPEHLCWLRLHPAPPPGCWLHFDHFLWQIWSPSWPALKPAVGPCSSGAEGTVLPRFLAAVFVSIIIRESPHKFQKCHNSRKYWQLPSPCLLPGSQEGGNAVFSLGHQSFSPGMIYPVLVHCPNPGWSLCALL